MPKSTGGISTARRPTRGRGGVTSTRRPSSRTPASSPGTGAGGAGDPEYELLDTGIFDRDRYWEITADYAKAAPDDLCIRVTVRNAAPGEQTIELLPTLWFRNTWSWGLHYRITVPGGGSAEIRLRLSAEGHGLDAAWDQAMHKRAAEADQFYAALAPADASGDEAAVMRQAFAEMLWSKQFFHYDVDCWLKGDPAGPPPPPSRRDGRNHEWWHLNNVDVISMPDKWEYPWFAAWDLAFHCVALARVDPAFAKDQLLLMCREWYMHPNGQIPAYKWAFGDLNPPVHAWVTAAPGSAGKPAAQLS